MHSIAGRYVPRAILMDLEPGTMDSVRSGPYGQVSIDSMDSVRSAPSSGQVSIGLPLLHVALCST